MAGERGPKGDKGEPGVAGRLGLTAEELVDLVKLVGLTRPSDVLDIETEHKLVWWEKLGLFVVVLLLVGGGLMLNAAGDVRQAQDRIEANQEDGRVRGLKNRAIDCEQSIAMGVPMAHDHPCNDAEVLEYYDPDAVLAALKEARSGTVSAVADVPKILSLVCRTLAAHGQSDPACGSG